MNNEEQAQVIQQLLRDQREANEKLVLAALRAHELADLAAVAQASAEVALAKLKETERELRATAEIRERLLAIVAHDLRNPLSAISMSAGRMLHRGALIGEDQKLVAGVLRSGERMSRMIRQLIDFTRVRLGGGLVLDLKPINLRELCLHAVAELDFRSDVRVRAEFAGDVMGAWDADRLTEVFSNIVGNAIEHATPGTDIVVTGRDEGPDAVVEFSNQGAPISAELLLVIFTPFRRARQQEWSRPGNLGLGLYIADQIVLAHGGTLCVRSEGGVTTFTMRLPRMQPPPS